MRRFLKNRTRGFTLIELLIVVTIVVVIAIPLLVLLIWAIVWFVGAYLIVNPPPDRIYDGGVEQRQEQSALVLPADDELLAAIDGSPSLNCVCLLKDQTQCVECAVAEVSFEPLAEQFGWEHQTSLVTFTALG